MSARAAPPRAALTLEERLAAASVQNAYGHKRKVTGLAWNCTGTLLASGSTDQTCRLWELTPTGLVDQSVLKGHTETVERLAWHPSQKDILVTVSNDKSVKIWDARSAKCVNTFSTAARNINVAWSKDGESIAIGSRTAKDDVVNILSYRASALTKQIKFQYEVDGMCWDAAGSLWLCTGQKGASEDGVVDIMRTALPGQAGLRRIHSVVAHTSSAVCVDIDASGRFAASGGADGLVAIIDTEDLVVLRVIDRFEYATRSLSFSFDGKFLAAGAEDLFVDISRVEDGRRVRKIDTSSSVAAVCWHPSQHLLAFSCDDKASGHDRGTVQYLSV